MTAPQTPADLLSSPEAAAYCALAESTLRRYAGRGDLPRYYRKGVRTPHYSRADLDRLGPTRPPAPEPAPVPAEVITTPAPSDRCEVVPVTLGQRTLEGWRLDGVELLPTRTLEEVLGYAPGSLVDSIRREWADDFDEGLHYLCLEGEEVIAVRSATESATVSPKARSLHTLTEEGVGLVLLNTRKPVGVALRKALAASGFMRELVRGNPEPLRRVTTGQQAEGQMNALILQHLSQQTEALSVLLQTVTQQQSEQGARMERLERALLQQQSQQGQEPPRPPDWHVCKHTVERVAAELASTYPSFRHNTNLVNKLVVELGLRGKGRPKKGQPHGLRGFTEQRRDGTGHLRWFYSFACIAALRESAGRLGFLPMSMGPGGGHV